MNTNYNDIVMNSSHYVASISYNENDEIKVSSNCTYSTEILEFAHRLPLYYDELFMSFHKYPDSNKLFVDFIKYKQLDSTINFIMSHREFDELLYETCVGDDYKCPFINNI